MHTIKEIAERNLRRLADVPYPGRLFVIGLDETGERLVQLYALTARSEEGRNRTLHLEGNSIHTQAADPTKPVGDTSLALYDAMLDESSPQHRMHFYVVSNGCQTKDFLGGLVDPNRGIVDALVKWPYEPDALHTPRISAVGRFDEETGHVDSEVVITAARKCPWNDDSFSTIWNLVADPGYGYCIHTYTGGKHPRPYEGQPFVVPLKGGVVELVKQYREVLESDNLISIAAASVRPGGADYFIYNKYPKVV
jgi:IMP cyclohydrolase